MPYPPRPPYHTHNRLGFLKSFILLECVVALGLDVAQIIVLEAEGQVLVFFILLALSLILASWFVIRRL